LHDSAHARHAVAAALAIMPAIDEMNRRFIAKGWPRIAIGVGINCGQMSVGNMGSSFRMAYTVLGDAVNLGSRLEGLTKQYGVPIIVSESVRQQAPDFLYRELDRVRVKGKQEPITIYEPLERLDAGEGDQLEQLQIWRDALTHYRQYAWPAARELIARLAENSPETLLYKIYLQRIDGFLITPPPDDWDGVYTHANK
jgi:adenylate cyclase